jgi:hypothetical protein
MLTATSTFTCSVWQKKEEIAKETKKKEADSSDDEGGYTVPCS